MTYVASRVMVHETVLNWHEQNAERDRRTQILEEVDRVVSAYTHVDSDSEQDW